MTMTRTRADVDAGGGDRLALAVLVQYRMATTEQMHLLTAPQVRIEQTRRRLAKLRAEGLVDRITLPQAGRSRVWFATAYGVQVAAEWPELRGRRPPRLVSDPVAARLRVSHTLTVTEMGLQFLLDARRRGEVCRPLDFLPEVHHPIGGGGAVIPDALVYYQRGRQGGDGGSMLRAPPSVRPRAGRPAPHGGDSPGGRGGVAAALPALPTPAVRPGRHRPRRHRQPGACAPRR
ncbi:replication-relaxation family protein [Streptomyces sp. NPDC052127]|uniref:replication-relaxation family protein n=1 Tax=Streptomyces sp. NPDC052127 TaxID=3155679 RepID=UPI0034127456